MSKKLLLADDSITIQKVIGITFANEDYDLTIVDNGDAALQKAQADKPQLILADVFMPGKNGYELCAAVKQDPNLQDVPVLLLTGTFEPFDEEKAVSSGANGWIAKPFESQSLIAKVEELIGAGAPSAAPAAPAQPVAPTPPPQPAAPVPPVQPAAPVVPTADADNWGDVTLEETPATASTEAPVFEDSSDFIIDDGSGVEMVDTSDVWADSSDTIEMAEPEVMAVEPTPPPQPAAPTPPVQPAAPIPTPPPQPAAPQPTAPAATAGSVEAQIAGLSDAALQQIVEKVAGSVLEKIAWEVVPDLAENLIKDEIRKLKEGS